MIYQRGNEYIKSIAHSAKFCLADLNCRMKIKWSDRTKYGQRMDQVKFVEGSL